MFHEVSVVFVLLATQLALFAGGWWLFAVLSNDDHRAAWHWGLFNLLLGGGMLLAGMRDETRGWWAYVGASLCVVGCFMAGWRGITAFMGDRQRTRWQLAIMSSVVALLLWAGPSVAGAPLRLVATYAGSALIIALAIRQIRLKVRAEFKGRLLVTLRWTTLLAVLMLGAMGVRQLVSGSGSLELHSPTGLNLGLIFSLLVQATLFNFACLGLQIVRYVRQLRVLTQRDPLTGLLNRRAFDEETQREWKRRRRLATPLAVAAFDLDHFKQVNDVHGHATGDRVLVHTAQVLRSGARELDIVARLGGEEFVVVMPATTPAQALAVADRLRQRLESEPVRAESGDTLHVTSSIGLAHAQPDDTDVYAVLKRADEALYEAKHAGRNRVCEAAVGPAPA